jgi:hypothetical protein
MCYIFKENNKPLSTPDPLKGAYKLRVLGPLQGGWGVKHTEKYLHLC